jgi:hypothetical protein
VHATFPWDSKDIEVWEGDKFVAKQSPSVDSKKAANAVRKGAFSLR